MIDSIFEEFSRGVVDEKKIEKVQKDPYKHFKLYESIGVRPPVLNYELPLDDDFLRGVAQDVYRSRDAGRRVGVEWMPAGARRIRKDDSDDHWASFEQLKPLNDVCTKWCTDTFFPDAFARVNMVANVVRVYDRLRDISGLKFNIVFKGGVMIRLVLLEFFNDLPLQARRNVTEYMARNKALSISDFDFEIVPKTHNCCDDQVHRFFLLDYAVLLWLQRIMQREVERKNVDNRKERKGLLSIRWDEEERRKQLHSYLQEAVDAVDDEESPFFKSRIDYVVIGDAVDKTVPKGYRTKSGKSEAAARKNMIIFDCDDTKCVMQAGRVFEGLGVRGVPSHSGGRNFYATLNTYIGETSDPPTRPGHLRGLFHLARIKHSFVVYYTTRTGQKCIDRLGGEMIDLSQSHGTRRDAIRHALYEAVPYPYQDYPILGIDPRTVVLRSYTVEGFLFDHRTMVHHTEEEPWNVSKKGKRLARYAGFLVAHVFSPSVDGSRATKVRAIEKLAGRLSSLETLLESPPLKTGVAPVDAFAAIERKSLLSAPKSKGKQYCRVLQRHLRFLIAQQTAPDTSYTDLDLNSESTIFGFLRNH
jgi:hypothetical protein